MKQRIPRPEEVMFVPELAEKMGLTQKALRRRVDDGRKTIPRPNTGWVRGIGHRLYWYRNDVQAWMRSHPH